MLIKFFLFFNILILLHASLIDNFIENIFEATELCTTQCQDSISDLACKRKCIWEKAPDEVLYLQEYFCYQKCFNAVKEHDLHPNSMKKCIKFCTAERGIK
ncbi:Potassium channel [Trichinella spiralis]|uniref:Potassium channel n=1 Tax=Trichinella spiralis TaxID=6334 RepID=A0ABR3K2C0_TRISP